MVSTAGLTDSRLIVSSGRRRRVGCSIARYGIPLALTLLFAGMAGCVVPARYTGPYISPDSQTIVCTRSSSAGNQFTREIRWCPVTDPASVRTHINKANVRRAQLPYRCWQGLFFSPDGKRLLVNGPSPEILDFQTGAVQMLKLDNGVFFGSLVWLNNHELIYARSRRATEHGGQDEVAVCRQRISESTSRLVALCKKQGVISDTTYVSPGGKWVRLLGTGKSSAEGFVAVDGQADAAAAPTWNGYLELGTICSVWRPDGSMTASNYGILQPDKSVSWSIHLDPVPGSNHRQIEKPIVDPNKALSEWTAEGKHLLLAGRTTSMLLVPETGEEIPLDAKFDQLLGKPKPGSVRVSMVSPTPGWLIVIDRPAKSTECCYYSRLVVDYEVTCWAVLSGTLTPDGQYEVSDPSESGNVKVTPSPLAQATTARRTGP